jgi:integrase
MALYKRGQTWWTDFTVNGQRFRLSLDTSDWREAQRLEKEHIASASGGKLTTSGQEFARLAFCEALDRYLADRRVRVAAKSHRTEADHAKPLREFYGTTTISRVRLELILAYIRERKEKGISNTTVNMEVGILRRLLKRAKTWHVIADDYKPLPENRSIGRAMKEEDKVRLLRIAANRPEWQIARLAATLALNTTMRGCEIRGLQWRDINLLDRIVAIRRSETKTDAGQRLIPINSNAWAAILELRERAKLLFGCEPQPDWYVFPHGEGQGPSTQPKHRTGPRVSVRPDPTRPMTTWRTAWRRLTRSFECPQCGKLQEPGQVCRNDKCKADIHAIKSSLHGLRFHDLRHHSITELAESQTSDQTIMAIAGHVSPRMLAHYSHVRLDAKRKALDGLAKGGASSPQDSNGTYVTTNVTKSASGALPFSQLAEKSGGDDGTRTRDLCRDRAAF